MATNALRNRFTYTLRDFYKDYRAIKASLGIKVKDTIPEKKYRGVIEGFLVYVMKKVIYENFSFILPYNMGIQSVHGQETNLKDAKVDFNKTKKLKKVVKHLNTHTFGFMYYIKWFKSHCNFKNHTYYSFRALGSGNATRAGVGRKVLSKHIIETSKNSELKSYTRI